MRQFTFTRILLAASILLSALTIGAQATGPDHGKPVENHEQRDAARASMESFVKGQMSNGTYYFFDAVENRLLALRFNDIHRDIRTDNHFHVSCSDFRDQYGRSVDIDFLAIPKGSARGSSFTTVQGVIHSIDGKERKYDLDLKR